MEQSYRVLAPVNPESSPCPRITTITRIIGQRNICYSIIHSREFAIYKTSTFLVIKVVFFIITVEKVGFQKFHAFNY